LIAALLADAVVVVVFAAVGRRSHDDSEGIAAVMGTAAPFLVALVLGWMLVLALGRTRSAFADPVRLDAGALVAVVTACAGLVLRRTLWDRGTALAFVIVAMAFLGVTIVGWRGAYGRLRRSRPGV
jgi:hypothetical protein